ncbi:PREDICTED: nose resistant to fluoxetine protein 6-like [Dinoponera quadriceps]|uniref:Nose resistant to fluoxetine protein 6-like n=1 Tax=Dinoponera quadriceps TaxID=609295 RepID=A0A6P3XXQ6_DINQU|nr:PREDICTED: nose resistant to fluoxetine protein 6-like [Dinoponera quadriceps]
MSRSSSLSCIRVIVLVLLCAAKQIETSNDTNNRLLPAYAIASRADLLNSTTCKEELRDFRKAVDHRILWGLKILDSSGGPKPGFLYGNNFWLGSRSQCQDTMISDPLDLAEREILNITLYRDPREEVPPFEVHYFLARFRHNSTLQIHSTLTNEDLIALGLCLPASCSTNDLGFILEGIFRDRTLLVGNVYSADFKLVEVKDLKDDHQWLFSGAIFFIGFVLAFTWILMIIGTIYDIFVYQKYLKAKNFLCTYRENTTSSLKIPNCDASDAKDVLEDPEPVSSFLRKENKIGQVLVCFSVYTNTRIIFDTELTTNAIPVIHGLRFLGMVWIIMVHTLYYSIDYIDNMPWIIRQSNSGFAVQILSNSTLTVDTYFFLSGFLLAYTYLSHRESMHKTQTEPINYTTKLKEFFVGVTKRLFRLTPAYMMTIGIVYLNSSWYNKTSQFYMNERPYETCAKYWWRNLLYINNLFSRSSMCMSWSWYLSNDMQFFVIGFILLILSTIYFYTTVVILCILLIGTIVLSGYISYVNDYVPTLDEQYRLLDVLYDPPWTRIGPYIIGMITAYVILKLNKKLILKRRTVILCWCLGSACNISVLFGLYERHISVLAAAFYVALSRTVWAIGLAWILLACYTKHGGIVNQLLSFKGWIPLSRLTFCAYLLNPFIISSIHLHRESNVHADFLPTAALFLGNLAISYFCAYALSLMSETPYILLIQKFLQRKK